MSGVYPNARVDLTGPVIKMWESPPPVEKRLVGPHLHLVRPTVDDGARDTPAEPSAPAVPPLPSAAPARLPDAMPDRFPTGSLSFGDAEQPFRLMAKAYGGGYDIDNIADAYRAQVGPALDALGGARLLKSFQAFCISYAGRRGPL